MQFMKEGLLFFHQVKSAQALDKGIMIMPQFFEPSVSSYEANCLPWSKFKLSMKPLGIFNLPGTMLECLVVPKNIAWSAQDINTYVGSEEREIREINDLSDTEGEEWFRANFLVASKLLTVSPEVQINIGFNPQEYSVGHHSIANLHSHIRTVGHKLDEKRRKRLNWDQFDWFDKLAFIEPFADLHNDFIDNFLTFHQVDGRIIDFRRESGYTSISLGYVPDLFKVFGEIKSLYSGMKREYALLENVFTDKEVDPTTGRYIPRERNEREELLDTYIKNNSSWLSFQSVEVLEYLANNLKRAKARSFPREISDASMAYITKGFAGAMSFRFIQRSDVVYFDFLPRVITTSGVTKTISGDHTATIIAKEKTPAEDSERSVIQQYQNRVQTILQGEYPDSYRSLR